MTSKYQYMADQLQQAWMNGRLERLLQCVWELWDSGDELRTILPEEGDADLLVYAVGYALHRCGTGVAWELLPDVTDGERARDVCIFLDDLRERATEVMDFLERFQGGGFDDVMSDSERAVLDLMGRFVMSSLLATNRPWGAGCSEDAPDDEPGDGIN